MKYLQDVCLHIHKQWWSYEWCHEGLITQFHIVQDQKKGQKTTILTVRDSTKLGEYKDRYIAPAKNAKTNEKDTTAAEDDVIDEEDDDMDEEEKAIIKREKKKQFLIRGLSKGETPLAVVVDKFTNGDVCPETKKPRSAEVEFHCCSADAVKSISNSVIHKGIVVPSQIAAIVSLEEPDICEYEVVVCTPLLCQGKTELYDQYLPTAATSSKNRTQKKRRERKPNESIRETLDRVLEDVCLSTNTNEW